MTGDIREALLHATLPHVPFDGWSERALKRGATEIGFMPEMACALFPGGGPELVDLYSQLSDAEMERRLAAADLVEMRMRDRVSFAVKTRLEVAEDEREAFRRAISLLILPANGGLAARLLYRTVDAIWSSIGDESSDWNFYSKRGLLAGVYASAVMYWQQDESLGCVDTMAFIDRRIADVMRLPAAMSKLRRPLGFLVRQRRPRTARL